MLFAIAGLAAASLVASASLKGGAELFPRVVSVANLLLSMPSLLLAVKSWPRLTLGGEFLAPLTIVGMIAAFVAGIYLFGPIPSTIVFILGSVLAIDRRGWVPAAISAVVSAVVIYLIFYLAQHVSWPRPLISILW